MRCLQFDQHKGQAVHESDQIRTALVKLAGDPHLRYQEKIILCRVIKIDDFDVDCFKRSMLIAYLRFYAVFDELVYLMVSIDHACGRAITSKLCKRLCYGLLRCIRIELFECLLKTANQNNLPLIFASQKSIALIEVGIDKILRAPKLAKYFDGCLLD